MTAARTTIGALHERMRREHADDPETLAELDRWWETDDGDFERNAPRVVPPCPSWCENAAPRHLYSETAKDDPLTYVRYHEWAIKDGLVEAWVSQEECNREGVVTYGPVEISGAALPGGTATLDQARKALSEWQTLIAKAEEAAR